MMPIPAAVREAHTTRFAPSPTGPLHLGHAFAALSAFDAAAEGRFVLRIEDLDGARLREEYVAAIREDLGWLGLSWPEPALRQSSRGEAYRAALGRLEERGLTYPCFCTRTAIAAEIARAGEAPHAPGAAADAAVYPGTCRRLPPLERQQRLARGEAFAVRLDAGRAAAQCPADTLQFTECGMGPAGEHGTYAVQPGLLGDIVLARKNLPAAYHLAVVLDDAFQGITLVTRGQDLFAATHVQRLLQVLLGLPEPRYAHHRLILDAQGRKFSKRERAPTLRALRQRGVSALQIREQLGVARTAH